MPYTGVTSLAAKQVCLGLVKHATCTDFDAKSRITLNFLQQLFATCNNLICCKTGLKVIGKTSIVAFQLVLQQCCKTSCTFSVLCPFYRTLLRLFFSHLFIIFKPKSHGWLQISNTFMDFPFRNCSDQSICARFALNDDSGSLN